MDRKAYIESGILEAYVLGALTAEERTAVEANMAMYPELAEEVKAIEETMLQYAKAHAATPPAHLKEKIRKQLEIKTIKLPANDVRPFTQTASRNAGWLKAAVWILLLATGVLSFLLWSQHQSWNRERLAQNLRIDSLMKQQNEMAALLEDQKKENDMLADTSMQTVVMRTMQPEHPMAATAYWGKNNGKVYVSFAKMPMPPQGMQYQLWVIQDGEPVSMGMIPNELLAKGSMMKVPAIVTAAQAFAISLERAGGNPTPTAVQVMGHVS